MKNLKSVFGFLLMGMILIGAQRAVAQTDTVVIAINNGNDSLGISYSAGDGQTANGTIIRFAHKTGSSGDVDVSIPVTVTAGSGDAAITITITAIGANAFKDKERVKSLAFVAGSKVESIGSSAFENCVALTTVTFPVGLKEIGSFAFTDCEALKGNSSNVLTFPDSLTTLGSNAFDGCVALAEVSFDVAKKLKAISVGAFNGCEALKTVTLPNSGNYALRSIRSNAFDKCVSLEKVNSDVVGVCNLPDSVLTIANYAFNGCEKLVTVNLPNGIPSRGVALDDHALDTRLYVSESAFQNCKGLTTLGIPANLPSLWGNISGTENITTLVFLSASNFPLYSESAQSTTFRPTTLYAETLRNLSSKLTTLRFETGARVWIGDATFNLPNSLTKIEGAGGVPFDSCTVLTNLGIPTTLTTVSANAFNRCTNLTTLTFLAAPSAYTGEGQTFTATAFKNNCKATLTTITCQEGAKVKSIGTASDQTGIFEGCTALETVDLHLSNSLTSLGANAFKDCPALKTVSLSNSLKILGDSAFTRCKALETVDLSDSLTYLGANAFKDCEALKTVDLPNTLQTLGDSAFKRCKALETLGANSLPNALTSLGTSAFYGCTNLTSPIAIPAGISTLADSVFYNCSKIPSITLHATLATIGKADFYNCEGITAIYAKNPTPPTGSSDEDLSNAFYGVHHTTTELYVVDIDAKTRYEGDGFWSQFSIIAQNNVVNIVPTPASLNLPADGQTSETLSIALAPAGSVGDITLTLDTALLDTAFNRANNTVTLKAKPQINTIAKPRTFVPATNLTINVGSLSKQVPVGLTQVPVESYIGAYIHNNGEQTVVDTTKGQVTITFTPSYATDQRVNYNSNNTAVAAIDQNGAVTPYATGTADITAYIVATGATWINTLTVSPTGLAASNAVNIVRESDIINAGFAQKVSGSHAIQLTPVLNPANATVKSVKWSSNDSRIHFGYSPDDSQGSFQYDVINMLDHTYVYADAGTDYVTFNATIQLDVTDGLGSNRIGTTTLTVYNNAIAATADGTITSLNSQVNALSGEVARLKTDSARLAALVYEGVTIYVYDTVIADTLFFYPVGGPEDGYLEYHDTTWIHYDTLVYDHDTIWSHDTLPFDTTWSWLGEYGDVAYFVKYDTVHWEVEVTDTTLVPDTVEVEIEVIRYDTVEVIHYVDREVLVEVHDTITVTNTVTVVIEKEGSSETYYPAAQETRATTIPGSLNILVSGLTAGETYTLYDLQGQRVTQGQATQAGGAFLNNIPYGTYILHTLQGYTTFTHQSR